jgi:hypothetical protein
MLIHGLVHVLVGNHHFAATNAMVDSDQQYYWILKSLGKRLLRNREST